jgi:HK97 family phage major capsid protein
MTLQELKDKRNKLVADIRGILDTAKADSNRSLNADEQTKIEAMEADELAYDKQIGIIERQEAREAGISASAGRRSTNNALENSSQQSQTADALRGFSAWATCHPQTRTQEMAERARAAGFNPDSREIVLDLRERANNSTATGAAGGYLVADAVKQGLTIAGAAYGGLYSAARVVPTAKGNPLPFDLFNDLSNEAVGVAQAGPSGYLPADGFDQIVLGAFKLSSNAIPVSSELLVDADYNVAPIIGEAIGRRLAVKRAKWFVNGAGTTEPYGIVTGATFTRPANGTNQSTTISTDQVLDLIHSVDPFYRTGASFLCSDSQVLKFRKLKNEANDYVWQESARAGEPSTLFGYSIIVDQAMPAPAANAKSLIFGNLKNFVVREVAEVRIIRSDELLMLNDQSLFIGYARYDSRLINPGVTNMVRGHQYAQAES